MWIFSAVLIIINDFHLIVRSRLDIHVTSGSQSKIGAERVRGATEAISVHGYLCVVVVF